MRVLTHTINVFNSDINSCICGTSSDSCSLSHSSGKAVCVCVRQKHHYVHSHKHAAHTCITTPLSSVRKGTSACSLLQLGYKDDWIHLGVVATKPTVSSTACWQWWVTLINYISSTFIFISYISILMLSFSVSFLFLYDVILCVILYIVQSLMQPLCSILLICLAVSSQYLH